MARTRVLRVTFQKHERGDRIRNPKLELARLISEEKGITLKRAYALIDLENDLKAIS